MFNVDFDISGETGWDEVRNHVHKLAAKHQVKIVEETENGPGGGNPNFYIECNGPEHAAAFLMDVYELSTDREYRDYVEPIIQHGRSS